MRAEIPPPYGQQTLHRSGAAVARARDSRRIPGLRSVHTAGNAMRAEIPPPYLMAGKLSTAVARAGDSRRIPGLRSVPKPRASSAHTAGDAMRAEIPPPYGQRALHRSGARRRLPSNPRARSVHTAGNATRAEAVSRHALH
eukprot:CAMPEP_0171192774 /NCGR_PEP_ID=MMETSP0790-20130122/20041_1 /TAXON_ID=2925 /ORGANISM="Alexandrium catenella, Strain OF101" /LENGTH=140 /DNA_ID=CAMNT_0011657939 /DNA_START=219 /DNA_END=638 /DNA_ORIENTATION=+